MPPPVKNPFCWCSTYRFFVAFTLCLGLLVAGLMRVSIGMAMVCMVNGTAIRPDVVEEATLFSVAENVFNSRKSGWNSGSSDIDSIDRWSEISLNRTQKLMTLDVTSHACSEKAVTQEAFDGSLTWDTTIQSSIFSAFFYGSAVASLPAGYLADRFGPKVMFTISMLLYIVGSLVTPVCAGLSYVAVIAVRAIMGVGEGMMQPCVASAMARWIPPDERAVSVSVYTSGAQLCMVVGMPLFAFLCAEKTVTQGWPSIFYVVGVAGIPWCIIWILIFTNSPEKNKFLPQKEKEYIALKLEDQNFGKRAEMKMPWLEMLKSMPVWACNVANFAASFQVFLLQSYLPTYFGTVLKLNMANNGLYSSTPFLVKWFVKLIFGVAADKLKEHTNLSRTIICKWFNSVGMFGPAVFFIAISFFDCDHAHWALVCLCFATGLSSGYTPGALTSSACLAPNFSGTLRSYTGVFNQLAGLLAPHVVVLFVVEGNRSEWQRVFAIVAGVSVLGGLFFCIWGAGEIQPWAKLANAKDKNELESVVLDNNNNGPDFE